LFKGHIYYAQNNNFGIVTKACNSLKSSVQNVHYEPSYVAAKLEVHCQYQCLSLSGAGSSNVKFSKGEHPVSIGKEICEWCPSLSTSYHQ